MTAQRQTALPLSGANLQRRQRSADAHSDVPAARFDHEAPTRRALGLAGRYTLHAELARGGMATVHIGGIRGAIGFVRAVAVKRLHGHFAKDQEFVSMLIDEARLVSRIRHINVVPILDVVSESEELYLVMDYVHGVTLSRLLHTPNDAPRPPEIAAAIATGALAGLHAAHEALDEHGQPLEIVHRDVSPQNVIVSEEGIARVLDFGIAKANSRVSYTDRGIVKGKMGYMSPEQLRGHSLDRRSDVYACGVLLWEALTGRRLFDGGQDGNALLASLEAHAVSPPSSIGRVPAVLDDVVMCALSSDPSQRFQSAQAMAEAIEACVTPASSSQVSRWLQTRGRRELDRRAALLRSFDADVVKHTTGEIDVGVEANVPVPVSYSGARETDSGASEPTAATTALGAANEISHTALTRRASSLVWPTWSHRLIVVVGALLALGAIGAWRWSPRAPAPPQPAAVVVPAAVPIAAAPEPKPSVLAVAAPAKPAARAPKPQPQRRGAKAASGCDPPYVLTNKGTRKYKPECFDR